MKNRFNPFLRCVATLTLGGGSFVHAADQYWNPSPLSENWANSVWSSSSGGGSLTTWTASNNAIFDQVGTYTATINADQTATNITIKNSSLTFAGTNRISSNSLTIDSGASLTAASDRFLKVGTTTLTVNGTLNQTAAVAASTQRVILAGGNGSIVFSGGLRTGGDFNFAGDISGTGSIVTDAAGVFTLSGNNTFAGDMLIRSGNTIRVGSANALSSNSFLRIGGGTNIIELTGADFSRTLGSSAGNVRFHAGADGAGSSGFAAVNADRTVALNGTVTWGGGLFNQTNFHLGTAASTHKVTLTTGINLNAATRTISTANGAAAVEAEISGVLSGATGSNLTKTGDGVLLLSNTNTFIGTTTISGGVLGLGNGGTTGSLAATGTIVNNANLTINRSNSVVQGTDFSSAAITGSGSFTQAGSGKTTFTVANAYTGATDVQNGTLQLNAALASTSALNLGNGSNSGKVILGNAAALAQTVAALTSTGTGTTNSIVGSAAANSTLTVNNSAANAYAGVLGGADTNENSLALTKTGAGVLTLSGNNTYTGVTTINGGTISVSSLGDGGVSGNLGAATSDAANIIFGGGALQYSAASAASSNRGFTITAASSATLNVSNATGALSLTGSVPTTTGVLYKTGSGSLTLDPGAISQSLGAISANGGELILKSGTYATTAKDGAVSAYNAGAGARGGTLTIDGATLNVGGTGINLKIAANGNGNLNMKSGAVSSGDIVIGHNGIGVTTQSGGTVTTNSLYHQDAGTGSSYTLSGGSLTAKRIYNNPNATSGTFTLNLNGGNLLSASSTTNLIDNQGGSSEISVLLGAGNTNIDTTASSASIVRPMGNMASAVGTFTKAGTNTLTLTATNTYTGATKITGGTLALTGTGSIANSSAIIVGASTTFDVSGVTGGFTLGSSQAISGTGTVAGAMTVAGTLSPGNSPGSLSTASQTWVNGGAFNWQILDATGTAGTGFDTMVITGSLDLTSLTAGGFNINLWSLASTGPDVNGDALHFSATTNYSWMLASTTTGISGFDTAKFTLNAGANNGTNGFSNALDGGAFTISQSGNSLLLNYTAAVPEPSVAVLGGMGLLALLRRRRR